MKGSPPQYYGKMSCRTPLETRGVNRKRPHRFYPNVKKRHHISLITDLQKRQRFDGGKDEETDLSRLNTTRKKKQTDTDNHKGETTEDPRYVPFLFRVSWVVVQWGNQYESPLLSTFLQMRWKDLRFRDTLKNKTTHQQQNKTFE